MQKKYLSIEEAAGLLGMQPSELNRLREKGEIRAYADRGTWKFKEEDVDKLVRSRQADSNPDVPMFGAGTTEGFDLAEDDVSDQPTIVKGKKGLGHDSDSDVKLVMDESLQPGKKKSASDSDSDVRIDSDVAKSTGGSSIKGATLADTTGEVDVSAHSDSDVRLSPEGSSVIGDVRLGDSDSDSDVKLVSPSSIIKKKPGSDSDVKLVSDSKVKQGGAQSDSDVALLGDEPTLDLGGAKGTSGSVLDDDHDSGITLAGADSGITIADSDSGITLAGADSGITLAGADSGISLEPQVDSGITLSDENALRLAGDSGISLETPAPNKGRKPANLGGTVPMIDVGDAGDGTAKTAAELPSFADEDSNDDFAISSPKDGSGSGTAVLSLEDDRTDEYSVSIPGDDEAPPRRGKKPAAVAAASDDDLDLDASGAMEISDDIVGEDDELAEDVFGADESDFESELESGESSAEMPAAGRMAAPVEQEWGAFTVATVCFSMVPLLCCFMVGWDLVRNMWLHNNDPSLNVVSSTLLQTLGSMF